ncbi:MAG: acyltransferase [Rhodobacteraceae bacterium]|nr:acyltransferase [Paracoccaceae bacterium]
MLPIRHYGDTDFITTMRAVAASMVVVIHTGAFSGYGWIGQNLTYTGKFGVHVFFVISGFTVATTFAAAPSYRAYLTRRLFRIVPLYYAIILAAVALYLGNILAPNYWQEFFGTDIDFYNVAMHLSLLSFLDYRIGTTIIGVEWTIPIEVFWYVFLPLFLLGITGWRSFWLVFGGLFLLGVAVAGLAQLLIGFEPGLFISWFPTTYSPYFMMGVAGYMIRKRGLNQSWLHANLLVLLAVLAFVLVIVFNPPMAPVLLALSTMLLIGFHDASSLPAFTRLAVARPLLFVGSISYSIYLLHHLVVDLFHTYLGAVLPERGIWFFLPVYGLTLLLASASYVLIERPSNSYGARLAAKSAKGKVAANL